MANIREAKEQFVQEIMNIVYKVLNNNKLLQGDHHLGKVESIVSDTKIKCFIDGSTTPITVAKSPDRTYSVGDEIWVIYPNRDANSKYAGEKRGV